MNYKQLILSCLLLAIVLAGSQKKLAFNENGEFNMLQLTDLHFGETDLKDLFTISLMNHLLQTQKPDLTILTGDMVSGFAWDQTSTFYQRQWKKYTSPITLHNSEYCVTLGNHDGQANLNRTEICDLDMTHPNSHTQKSANGLSEGSNYYLPIYESSKSDKVKAILWVLDSQDSNCMGVQNSYGCIQPDIIEWVRQTLPELNAKYPDLLHLAFYHIPLPEYIDLYNHKEVYGFRMEGVGCPKYNTNFYAVMKELGIKAGFCGHDHNNDFGGDFDGVELVYARKTGFGCYGPPIGRMRGGRGIYLKIGSDGKASYSHDIVQYDGSHIPNEKPTKRANKIISGPEYLTSGSSYLTSAKMFESPIDDTIPKPDF